MSELDEVALLEGAAVEPALTDAAAVLVGRLEGWSLRGLHHRPGAGVTGIYGVRCLASAGPLDVFICITTRPVAGDFPRSVRLRGPADEVLLAWCHPHDPLLPGLQWACDARSVGSDLFGVASADLSTLGYRPMRRAVLRAEAAGETRFLKALPKGRTAALRRRHELLLEAGVPAPEPVNSPSSDVLVTLPASGTPLSDRLMADGASGLEPQTLLDLLDSFPPVVCVLPAKPPWSARVRDYARAAASALPDEAERISALAAKVESMVRAAPSGPRAPTHGDFYEGNLLVSDGKISALLDLDNLGPGHQVDDLACFLAHLAVLPGIDERYRHVPAALVRFERAFEQRVDPDALRARAAGVALTLVAGARNPALGGAGEGWRADARRRLQVAESFL